MTTAIIGGIIGLIVGTLIGYKKTGKLLSWKTAWYAFLGLLMGAAIGAMIGAGIGAIIHGVPFGALNSIAKVSSKLIQQFVALRFGVTLIVFICGAIAGAITEYFAPDRWHEWITLTSILSLPATSTILIIWSTLATRVPGFAQESLAAVAGFNLGYFGARGVRKLGDWASIPPEILDRIKENYGDE